MAKQRMSTSESIQRVLHQEANAILDFANQAEVCSLAANLIFKSTGPLIVSGIGKSGHIATKIASTFRSLGKPAFYIHAAEASHGDLGIVQSGSVALILSNSGETTELSDLIHFCKANDIPIISLTSGDQSTLAKSSQVAIVYQKVAEACQNGLAPTTSTTLSLAIGDALAVAVSEMLGVEPEDFRRYHPGGKLGTRLTTIDDIMHVGNRLPIIDLPSNMSEVLVKMSEKALGISVLMKDDTIAGVITDGDLRRNVGNLLSLDPMEIATHDPIMIKKDWFVLDAVEFMSKREISVCLVADDAGKLVGLVHIHDCVKSGATI